MAGVRTRHVQLVGGDPFSVVQNLDDLDIVLHAVAEYVGENLDVTYLAEQGQLLLDECLGTDGLQADRIEHSSSGFVQARRRIACHRLTGQPLDDKAAELRQGNDVFKLHAIAEGSRCGDDRVLDPQPAEFYGGVELSGSAARGFGCAHRVVSCGRASTNAS